jgi:hypothetical protein
MVEVVRAVNCAGYATTDSCIGTPGVGLGRAYVGFVRIEDAVAVCESVLRSFPEIAPQVLAMPTVPASEQWCISVELHGEIGALQGRCYLTLPAEHLARAADAVLS